MLLRAADLGLSCSISFGDSSRDRLHLDLVDHGVEDVLRGPKRAPTSTATIIPFWYFRDLSPRRIVAVLRCDRAVPRRSASRSSARTAARRDDHRPAPSRASAFRAMSPLAAVGEEPRRVIERQPAHLGHLVAMLRRDVAEPAALVADEEERDDLEDPLALPVEASSGRRRACRASGRGRPVSSATSRSAVSSPRSPSSIRPFGQRPEPGRLARGPDRRHHPAAACRRRTSTPPAENSRRIRSTDLSLATRDRPLCLRSLALGPVSARRQAQSCHKWRSNE